jgi:acyl-CoA reductase-like NAD-dependent aldehyde dehydrogenase
VTRLSAPAQRQVLETIRHRRAELTAQETYWQQQPVSEQRTEAFRLINFWRNVYRDAERRFEQDAAGETEAARLAS